MARHLFLVGALAAAAALAFQPDRTAAPAVDATLTVTAPGPQPAVASVPVVADTAADAADAPAPALLLLPDGTSVAALNGAVAPPPLARALGQRAFAPIVGVERSAAGVDWYVHADGVRSTTEMRWRQDLGRYDALTRVALPVEGSTPPAMR